MFPFNLKIFLMTVMLGFTVELFAGVTYASFSASNTVGGNVFSTGTWGPTSIPTPTPTQIPGLIAYWKMDEGTGTIIADSSGNGHTLTLNNFNFDANSGWSTDNPIGSSTDKSLLFDGSNDVATTPDSPDLSFSSAYTIEAWIKAQSQSGDTGIVSKWNGNGYLIQFMDGRINNLINGSNSSLSPVDLRDNIWHHIAVVWNGVNRFTYVDGLLNATDSFSTAPTANAELLQIGNYFTLPRYFRGNIDEVKIWNIVRSQLEIQTDGGVIMSPTSTPTLTPTPTITPIPTDTPTPTLTPTPGPTLAPGLIAYWKMEQSTGSTINDESENNRGLTINGTADWVSEAPATTLASDIKSLHLDGSTFAGLSESGNNYAFDFPNGFTIEAWIKTNSSQDSGIISKFYPANKGYIMQMLDSGINNYIDGSNLKSSISVGDGQWHYVAITWDGSQKAVYVDGNLEGAASWSAAPQSTGNLFLLGTYAPGSRNFSGNINEVKVWNIARSQSEIQTDGGMILVPTSTPTVTLTPTPTPTVTITLTPTPT